MSDAVALGRGAIRTALTDALDASVGGQGRLLLLTGEPGMGKTTLARELAQQGRRAGAVVRWAACWAGGTTVAHAPWLNLLSGLGARGEQALVALLGSDADDPGAMSSARAAAYALVTQAIEAAAAERPVLVVLDDLHWADAGSVQLLGAVAGQLPAMPALVVGTYRDAEVPSGAPLTTLGASADRLSLAGLSDDEVAALLVRSVGRVPGPDVVAEVRAKTGGNPFLVVQLGRLLATDPSALTGEGPLPAGARDLLANRLAVLAPGEREVLAAAAVLGSPFGVGELGGVLGRSADDVVAALDRAAAARVVERVAGVGAWAFVHDLFRQAALDGVAAVEVSRLHLAAAKLLAEADAEPAAVARHLLAASSGLDLEAAAWSVGAGERALAAMAWEEAAAHFQRALGAAPLDVSALEVRADALLGLGRSRLLSGDAAGAGAAFEDAAVLAREHGATELLARAALGFSADLAGFEVRLFEQRQIDLLERAATALADADAPGLRATVLARLSVALTYTGADARRLPLAERAVSLAREAGVPAVLGRALAAHCDAIASPAHVEERVAEATEIVAIAEQEHDGPLELLGRRMRFVALLERGDVAPATAEAAAFARRAAAVGNPLYSFYVPLWRGQAALADGNTAECESAIAEVRELAAAAASRNGAMLAYVLELELRWARGEYAEAVRAWEGLAEVEPDLVQFLSSAGAAARTYILNGQTDRARSLLDHCAAVGLDALPFDAEWLPSIVMLLDAAADLDHPILDEVIDRATPYAHLFAVEGIGAGLYGSVARYLARACSVRGAHEDAVAWARQALDANRAAGAVLVADAERTLAECLSAAGARPEPRPAGAPLPGAAAPDNELRRDGDVWHVSFAGSSTILKHSKGVSDLAVLLADPSREAHVSELEGVPRALVAGDGGEALDRRAIAAYKERLAELAEELDDADSAHDLARAEKARIEYDALVEHLSGSLGLGGRSRSAAAEPVERMRKAVTARIRDAIRRIEAVHPALGRHLSNSVRTGLFCSYVPETAVVWRCESRSGAPRA